MLIGLAPWPSLPAPPGHGQADRSGWHESQDEESFTAGVTESVSVDTAALEASCWTKISSFNLKYLTKHDAGQKHFPKSTNLCLHQLLKLNLCLLASYLIIIVFKCDSDTDTDCTAARQQSWIRIYSNIKICTHASCWWVRGGAVGALVYNAAFSLYYIFFYFTLSLKKPLVF